MGAWHLGTKIPEFSGVSQIAESNGLIVIYPQAAINDPVENDYGCWDNFGYTDDEQPGWYLTKYGVQNTAIFEYYKKVIDGTMEMTLYNWSQTE